ncbi:MAG: GxxExxY protein [Candidatus Schekmanbacteria bacterium]|nr:GxxExxY protein [Candidatus Schekmanbacteria bacterium]
MEVNELTELIIGAAIQVHRELIPGLLESAYQACLAFEIADSGLGLSGRYRCREDGPELIVAGQIDDAHRSCTEHDRGAVAPKPLRHSIRPRTIQNGQALPHRRPSRRMARGISDTCRH